MSTTIENNGEKVLSFEVPQDEECSLVPICQSQGVGEAEAAAIIKAYISFGSHGDLSEASLMLPMTDLGELTKEIAAESERLAPGFLAMFKAGDPSMEVYIKGFSVPAIFEPSYVATLFEAAKNPVVFTKTTKLEAAMADTAPFDLNKIVSMAPQLYPDEPFQYSVYYGPLTRGMASKTAEIHDSVLCLSNDEKLKLMKALLYGRVQTLRQYTPNEVASFKTVPEREWKDYERIPDPLQDTPAGRMHAAPSLTTISCPVTPSVSVTIGFSSLSVTANKRDVQANYQNQVACFKEVLPLIKDSRVADGIKQAMAYAKVDFIDSLAIKYRLKRGVTEGVNGKLNKKGALVGIMGPFGVVTYGTYPKFADMGHFLQNVAFDMSLTYWAPTPLGITLSAMKSDKGRDALGKLYGEIRSRLKPVDGGDVLKFLGVAVDLFDGKTPTLPIKNLSSAVFLKSMDDALSTFKVMAGDKAITEVASSYLSLSSLSVQILCFMGVQAEPWGLRHAHNLILGSGDGYLSDDRSIPNEVGEGKHVPRKGNSSFDTNWHKKVAAGSKVEFWTPSACDLSQMPSIVDMTYEHAHYVLTGVDVTKAKHGGQRFALPFSLAKPTFPPLFSGGKALFKKAVVMCPISLLEGEFLAGLSVYHVSFIFPPIHCPMHVVLCLDSVVPSNKINAVVISHIRYWTAYRVHLYTCIHANAPVNFHLINIFQREWLGARPFIKGQMTLVNDILFQQVFDSFAPVESKSLVAKGRNLSKTKPSMSDSSKIAGVLGYVGGAPIQASPGLTAPSAPPVPPPPATSKSVASGSGSAPMPPPAPLRPKIIAPNSAGPPRSGYNNYQNRGNGNNKGKGKQHQQQFQQPPH